MPPTVAAVKVKSEPGCIKGYQGKDLSSTIARTLPKYPQWVRGYYMGKIRWQKTETSAAKKEFLENLLSEQGLENAFFKKLHTTLHVKEEETEGQWLSWTALLKVESEAVIKLSLKQKKMERRPPAHTHCIVLYTSTRLTFLCFLMLFLI